MGLMKEMLKGTTPWAARNGETYSTIQQHGDGDVTVATYQDPSKTLEENKNLRNDDSYSGDFKDQGWGRRVASIPNIVLIYWKSKLGIDYMDPTHSQAILQLLDDPEWSWCKCVDEKVARKRMRTYMKASTAAPKVVASTRMPNA